MYFDPVFQSTRAETERAGKVVCQCQSCFIMRERQMLALQGSCWPIHVGHLIQTKVLDMLHKYAHKREAEMYMRPSCFEIKNAGCHIC